MYRKTLYAQKAEADFILGILTTYLSKSCKANTLEIYENKSTNQKVQFQLYVEYHLGP